MVTKEEFIERFKHSMAGIALYGTVTDATGNLIAKTTLALSIPEKIETWLGLMYQFMAASIPQPPLTIQPKKEACK